jgi:hypothetical protein
MGRWLLPITLALGAGWLTYLNHGGGPPDTVATLPFVQLVFPETRTDPLVAGQRSEQVAWGLVAAATLLTALEQLVRRSRSRGASS